MPELPADVARHLLHKLLDLPFPLGGLDELGVLLAPRGLRLFLSILGVISLGLLLFSLRLLGGNLNNWSWRNKFRAWFSRI